MVTSTGYRIHEIPADQYFDIKWNKALAAELWAETTIDRRRFQIGLLVGGRGWRVLRNGSVPRMYIEDESLRTLARLKFS